MIKFDVAAFSSRFIENVVVAEVLKLLVPWLKEQKAEELEQIAGQEGIISELIDGMANEDIQSLRMMYGTKIFLLRGVGERAYEKIFINLIHNRPDLEEFLISNKEWFFAELEQAKLKLIARLEG